MNTPILFLIFNRPLITRRVFSAIRDARPPRLYVAADGPRLSKIGEAARCKEAQSIATAVDWPCEVHTLFRDENLGCRRAVSGAIDWFFENEEAGIIIEDDCLADATWFTFAQEMLERYADDPRIYCISASHFPGKAHAPKHSYYFSIYNHCWGWASWRRAWSHYDFDMEEWPELRNTDWLLDLGNGNRQFKHYWTDIFDRIYARSIDTWGYYWTYSVWTQRGLTVLPARNLIVNLGFGPGATHFTAPPTVKLDMKLEPLESPLTHPTDIAVDKLADGWTTKHHFGISKLGSIKRDIAAVPFLGPAIIEFARWYRSWR